MGIYTTSFMRKHSPSDPKNADTLPRAGSFTPPPLSGSDPALFFDYMRRYTSPMFRKLSE